MGGGRPETLQAAGRRALWLVVASASGCLRGGCAGEDLLGAPVDGPLGAVGEAGLEVAVVAGESAELDRLESVRVGDRLTPSLSAPEQPGHLTATGFVAGTDGTYRRVAAMGPASALVPSRVAAWPELGAAAVISIDRGGRAPPYIFTTLRSLFARLPRGLEVNVLVGDERTDYLAPARLRGALGDDADHVHVRPAEPAQAAFLRDHYGVHARAAWNYGRALRSHTGPGDLLLLEDDIVWAEGAAEALTSLLAQSPPPALSLYNFFCQALPGGSGRRRPPVDIRRLAAAEMPWKFSRTQAMFFAGPLARAVGVHLHLRLGEQPYDLALHDVMVAHRLSFGFAQPSIVQHIGRRATGLGAFHESPCLLLPGR